MDNRLDKGLVELSQITAKGKETIGSEISKMSGVAQTISSKMRDVSKQTLFHAEQGDKESQLKAFNEAEAAISEIKMQAEILKESTEKLNRHLEKKIEEMELQAATIRLSLKK